MSHFIQVDPYGGEGGLVQADGTGVIEGHVRNYKGEGVAGVTVRSDYGIYTTTMSDGYYVLVQPAGQWIISVDNFPAHSLGTGAPPMEGGVCAFGGEISTCEFYPHSGCVAGVTKDRGDFSPLGNVKIEIGGHTIYSDANGNYETPELPAGTYSMTVSKEGYETKTYPYIDVPEGNTYVIHPNILSLGAPQFHFEGQQNNFIVSNKSGLLIPIVTQGTDITWSVDEDAPDGMTIDPLTGAMDYTACRCRDHYEESFYVTATNSHGTIDMRIYVEISANPLGGCFYGIVEDENHNPIAGATITAKLDRNPYTEMGTTTSDADGYYDIGFDWALDDQGDPVGEYKVTAQAEGYESKSKTNGWRDLDEEPYEPQSAFEFNPELREER